MIERVSEIKHEIKTSAKTEVIDKVNYFKIHLNFE
jgi:hypothetical protein